MLSVEEDALVVPQAAVQVGQSNTTYVFVVKPDNTAEMRPVRVTRNVAGKSVIAKGLEPGEQVVTDGQLRLSNGSRVEIRSAARKLPIEMTTPPSFQKVNPADQPVLYISLNSETLPLSVVDEYAETLMAQRISMLLGVAQVQVFGAQKFAVRVQVRPDALAAKGISIDEVRSAVAAANSNTPVGQLSGPDQSFTLQANAKLANAAKFRTIPIAYRNGAPVRLGDIATVVDSVENDKIASWYNGRRGVILPVLR